MIPKLNTDYIIEILYPNSKNHPNFYLFESKYPKRKHFTSGFLKLCKELKIGADIKLSCNRYEYDDSDNTAWILFFGENKKELEKTREHLQNIEYNNQKVFNVSGNGYGTGLSVMLNYNKFWK